MARRASARFQVSNGREAGFLGSSGILAIVLAGVLTPAWLSVDAWVFGKLWCWSFSATLSHACALNQTPENLSLHGETRIRCGSTQPKFPSSG